MEGGSIKLIREEWSLQDYSGLCRHWRETAPPPYISLRLIATAHGAKFDVAGSSAGSAAAMPSDCADPLALAAYLGQSDVLPYVAPRRGLIIDPGGNS